MTLALRPVQASTPRSSRHPLARHLPMLLTLFALTFTFAAPAPAGEPGQSSQGRVIVLGFDGASYSTARELIEAGRLPNLARLAADGTFEPLGTTLNAESAVAWAALNTGRNPSETGIPGFIKRELLGSDGKPVQSGGSPSPGLGYQEREDRRVADLDAGFPIGLLSRWDAPVLAGGFGALVFLFFLLAFMVLLRLRAVPAVLLSGLLGGIGGFGAFVAKGYVPEVVPQVVANPLAADPFWEVAARNGVESVVLDGAMCWDRPPVEGARVLAGLGLPDCRGGTGDWFIYTTDEYQWDRPPKGRQKDPAGTIFRVDWREDRIEAEIYGPVDFCALDRVDRELSKIRAALEDDSLGWKKGEELRRREEELLKERSELEDRRITLPLVIEKTATATVRVTLGTTTQELDDKRWSDYYHLEFELNPLIKVRAVTRVRVLSMEPFRLFVNTLDIDPSSPPFWQPITQPMGYSRELVHLTGSPFETFGWACITMPLKAKEIEPEILLEDIEFTMGWRERLMKEELARDDWRLLMSVESTPDRLQHMMYHYYDQDHPLHDPEIAGRTTTFFGQQVALRDTIPVIYQQVDRIVGEVVRELRPDDTLIICADHGFQSFRHQFHVNNWLAEKGYLVLREGVTKRQSKFLMYADWTKTRAYSLGFGVVYLNLQGRERDGIVRPEEADALMRQIADDLLAAADDRPGREGTKAIDQVTFFKDVHHGPYVDREGDIMIGFAPHYRVSWATTLGDIELDEGDGGEDLVAGVYEANKNPWSGDHVSVAPGNVPGIFFCNRPLQIPEGGVDLLDIAPTALALLGVDLPVELDRPPLRLR